MDNNIVKEIIIDRILSHNAEIGIIKNEIDQEVNHDVEFMNKERIDYLMRKLRKYQSIIGELKFIYYNAFNEEFII